MPFLPTSQEWLTQSTLLLQARPTTTRIITKYHLPSATELEAKGGKNKRKRDTKDEDGAGSSKTIVAELVLRTYDPVSGACLKYRTDESREVGKLIGALHSLGRGMAGMGSLSEDAQGDVVMKDAVASAAPAATTGGAKAESKPATAGGAAEGGAAGGGSGGGKKKKKKGKN